MNPPRSPANDTSAWGRAQKSSRLRLPGMLSARSTLGLLRRSTLRLALAGRSLVQLTPTEISPEASSAGISR
ncbi:hypothetical protein D9M71_640850 [compost metagenome]